jgi:hypothetical protein
MLSRRGYLTQYEAEVYELLETARGFSTCSEGQHAAISCNIFDNSIQSVSWDAITHFCDKKCEVKNTHCSNHAIANMTLSPDSKVYTTSFPCLSCQLVLFSHGITEVYVFGEDKGADSGVLNITVLPDVAGLLVKANGYAGQEMSAIAEMAELTTSICDNRRVDNKPAYVPSEILDVELQLHCLRRVHSCVGIQSDRLTKYNELSKKYGGEENDN